MTIRYDALKRSFSHAIRGLSRVAGEEQSFRIQTGAAAVVVVLMFALDVRPPEKALLLLAIAMVLVLELVNSIFERIADMMQPRVHHYVADIKDIMAGAVLVASAASAFIGAVIFWPYLTRLFS